MSKRVNDTWLSIGDAVEEARRERNSEKDAHPPAPPTRGNPPRAGRPSGPSALRQRQDGNSASQLWPSGLLQLVLS